MRTVDLLPKLEEMRETFKILSNNYEDEFYLGKCKAIDAVIEIIKEDLDNELSQMELDKYEEI